MGHDDDGTAQVALNYEFFESSPDLLPSVRKLRIFGCDFGFLCRGCTLRTGASANARHLYADDRAARHQGDDLLPRRRFLKGEQDQHTQNGEVDH